MRQLPSDCRQTVPKARCGRPSIVTVLWYSRQSPPPAAGVPKVATAGVP
jgi:hypothetical protein